MQNNIVFFQSTEFGAHDNVGIIDLLITQIDQVGNESLFEKIQIIVPNQAVAVWVKDYIASKKGICANIDCVVLPGAVIENIFLANNPHEILFDFARVKLIIYEYLLNYDLSRYPELTDYLLDATGEIDKLKAFELARQLHDIFHEYLYLRTEELINLKTSRFKEWQKEIWLYVSKATQGQITFLDIYKYFATSDLSHAVIKLPRNLFIFGLTSVYPSQLQILIKLANYTNIFWYYQACSYEYYGDLLTDKARSKIEQKLLRKPDLSLDDLYLTNGNQLLANCGQQSREFVELLRANDVQVYDFMREQIEPLTANATMLEVIQHDIRSIKERVRSEYRLSQNDDYYLEPLMLNETAQKIYDLANHEQSIKINICHNRMREVQVMFNEVVTALNKNPELQCNEILISAPDIDDYASYIQAIFDNEYVNNQHGQQYKLPYQITGNRRHNSYKIIEVIKLLLQTPYALNVSYLIEILQQNEIQRQLQLDNNDIVLVKKWLADNHTYFGYSAADYQEYGYNDYPVHSFRQLIMNIVLGSCLDETVFTDNATLPELTIATNTFVPYDNLDNAQVNLANQLIALIDLLAELRAKFYLDSNNYHTITLATACEILEQIKAYLVSDDDELLLCDKFIGEIRANNSELEINLPILIALIDGYMSNVKNRLTISGKINCMSLQYARNLPFKYIYVLGLNFGEFPTGYQANQLSLLADEWYLADRNYNIEDKQAFLDVILAARHKLTLSYIGRRETDNGEIKPSPLVSLLIKTLGQSFSNFWDVSSDIIQQKYDFKNLIEQHSLHPFYNNKQYNYSQIWQQISQMSANEIKNLRWDFSQISPLKLTPEQYKPHLQINLKSLISTFSYANCNLYRVLGMNTFYNDIVLEDVEPLELANRNLATGIYTYFNKYASNFTVDELRNYLHHKGVIGYQQIGDTQFSHYWHLYQRYCELTEFNYQTLEFAYELNNSVGESFTLHFNDEVAVNNDGVVIIADDFVNLGGGELAKKLDGLSYRLKIRGLVTYLMLTADAIINHKDLPRVVIRQINSAGEYHDFPLSVMDADELFPRVLRYYIRSLTNPVVIHKPAISEYAKAMNDCYKNGQLKNTPAQCLEKAQAKYSADWENYELEALRLDMVFSAIADNYFEYIQQIGGVNDIAQIGNMLANLRG